METTSIVFKQLIQKEKIGKFEKRLYNKTKETEVNIFLAKKKKKIGDKIKRKEITLGALQRKIGVGKRLNIMNAVLLSDVPLLFSALW